MELPSSMLLKPAARRIPDAGLHAQRIIMAKYKGTQVRLNRNS